jgi:N6-L-threonylcarbamoyladenine synthase
MPTTPRKARTLLSSSKAKVLRRTPFTIKLLFPTGETKQNIALGVDAGTRYIGISATTNKKVLYEAEVILRTDIQRLLVTRSSFRRTRRLRKTRYREPRFLNKRRSKGWLPPSIQNKVDQHCKIVKDLHGFLPIITIGVEVAQFDIQKINNPGITGVEYQQGAQLGFWNVREYVLFRDGHKCQNCKGKTKDRILNVHHIEGRKTGGDSPNNLITLCKVCHDRHHREGLVKELKRKVCPLKYITHVSITRNFVMMELQKIYSHVGHTYGYVTKYIRVSNGLEKSHAIDARCISGNPLAAPDGMYLYRQVRGQNRQLHKSTILKGGIHKKNKAHRYVKGFQLFDKVLLNKQECFVFGRRERGSFNVRLLEGMVINADVSYNKLRLLEKAKTLLIQRKPNASGGETAGS